MNTTSIITVYVVGSAVAALGVYGQRRMVRDDGPLELQNLPWVSVLAGLVWPIVLLGAIQFGALFALRRLMAWFSPVAPHDVFKPSVLQLSQLSQSDEVVTPDMGAKSYRLVRAA